MRMAPVSAVALGPAILAGVEDAGPSEAFGLRNKAGGVCKEGVLAVRDFWIRS